jgi:hypothetical protein
MPREALLVVSAVGFSVYGVCLVNLLNQLRIHRVYPVDGFHPQHRQWLESACAVLDSANPALTIETLTKRLPATNNGDTPDLVLRLPKPARIPCVDGRGNSLLNGARIETS